jgi:hypothetical protein
MAIASRSHWVDVERARGLAVLVFLEENSTLDYIRCQCNSCGSTVMEIIAASRAATGKKLETFMLATKEQTVTIDVLGGRQTRGDRSIERARERLASSERRAQETKEELLVVGFKRRETQTILREADSYTHPTCLAGPTPHRSTDSTSKLALQHHK